MNVLTPSRDSLLDAIYESIDEVNQQLAPEHQIVKSLATSLFDGTNGLDSLSHVTLIALIEEKCHDRFGVSISFSDDNPGDALDTIAAIVSFLELRLASQPLHRQ
jgi:acyl carrier protein